MRHNLGYRKLNKTGEHRKALFKNMLNSLIKYEQIITTLPKAKELKPQIDKVITIGKKNILSNIKAGFRTGEDAPMAEIELVDRNTEARKIDKPKKVKEEDKKQSKEIPQKTVAK